MVCQFYCMDFCCHAATNVANGYIFLKKSVSLSSMCVHSLHKKARGRFPQREPAGSPRAKKQLRSRGSAGAFAGAGALGNLRGAGALRSAGRLGSAGRRRGAGRLGSAGAGRLRHRRAGRSCGSRSAGRGRVGAAGNQRQRHQRRNSKNKNFFHSENLHFFDSLYSLSARAAECCARAFVKAVSDYSIFCVKDKMFFVHFNEL